MKDFGSRDKNLYEVASSLYPVKRLGRTYTERPKSVLGICSKPAHIILMGDHLRQSGLSMAAIVGPGGPSMATKFAIDGPGGPVVVEDHLRRDRTRIVVSHDSYSCLVESIRRGIRTYIHNFDACDL